MKKIIICIIGITIFLTLAGCAGSSSIESESNNITTQNASENTTTTELIVDTTPENITSNNIGEEIMKISIKSSDYEIIYELNNSQAAKDLYSQLPLALSVEDFSTNEKIFYPPNELDTSNTPTAEGYNGSLCYYSPWGDVVMFYDHFSQNSSLYELGQVVSGENDIENLTGTITVSVYEE
ncbi:hypothetical protein NDGK_00906 [Clostridiales bacterium CHKCI001]|nr:hypothetical protein NDGK_00906 [Clostridiales bacterium CHKCI001]